jgi:type IV secretory pathway ATPase VirB11/archaellum biosynthesis ATPase
MRFAAVAMTTGHPNVAAIIIASVHKTITRNAEEDKERSCASAGVREPCCLTCV